MATMKKKNDKYYCTQCMMSYNEPKVYCPFCGEEITNYEELIINNYIKTIGEEGLDDEDR